MSTTKLPKIESDKKDKKGDKKGKKVKIIDPLAPTLYFPKWKLKEFYSRKMKKALSRSGTRSYSSFA